MNHQNINIAETIRNLESRNFNVLHCTDSASACEAILSLIPPKSRIGWGGSHTLSDMGLFEKLRQSTFIFHDRSTAKTEQERDEVYAKIQTCDYFLTGINAVTEDGQLVNMDGRSDRVSFLCFGPKHVIAVCGINKIVPDLESAMARIKQKAAPENAVSLKRDTPCVHTGTCTDCRNPNRLCCNLVISSFCRTSGRITVVLVDETLGF